MTESSDFAKGAPLSRNTADASTCTFAFLDISIAMYRVRTRNGLPCV